MKQAPASNGHTSQNEDQKLDRLEGFIPGSGHVATRPLKATPDQIDRAADAWAGYFGWFRISADDEWRTYRFGRFVVLSADIEMTVLEQAGEDGCTEARFELGSRPTGARRGVPIHKEFVRAGEYFADGVANELAYELFQLPAYQMQDWERKQRHWRAAVRVRRATYLLFPIAAVLVTALVWLVTWNGFWGMATLSWLFALTLLDIALRNRSIGMRSGPIGLMLIDITFVGMGVLFTVWAATGAR